jgi:XTP/dITP diphosphohydrolase
MQKPLSTSDVDQHRSDQHQTSDADTGYRILIGTSNPGKHGEIMEVMGDLPVIFLRPSDLDLDGGVDENGSTYEENAEIKARHFHSQCGFLTLAEDSGIVVDALAGELGIKTRRWGAGGDASDEEWIRHFLEVMRDVPENKRTARFVCCAAVIGPGDGGRAEVRFFRGETEGIITKDLEVPIIPGIPLSSCFRPVGFDKVYAALSTGAKNSISHRGKAMRAAKDYLEQKISAKVN